MLKFKGNFKKSIEKIGLSSRSLILFLIIALVGSIIAGFVYFNKAKWKTPNNSGMYQTPKFSELLAEDLKGVERNILVEMYNSNKFTFITDTRVNKKSKISDVKNNLAHTINDLSEQSFERLKEFYDDNENDELIKEIESIKVDGGSLSHYQKQCLRIIEVSKNRGLSEDKIAEMELINSELTEVVSLAKSDADILLSEIEAEYKLIEEVIAKEGKIEGLNKDFTIELNFDPNEVNSEKGTIFLWDNILMMNHFTDPTLNSAGFQVSTEIYYDAPKYIFDLLKMNTLVSSMNYDIGIKTDISRFDSGEYKKLNNEITKVFSLKTKYLIAVIGLMILSFIPIKYYNSKTFKSYRKLGIWVNISMILASIVLSLVTYYTWLGKYAVGITILIFYPLLLSDITYILNHGIKSRLAESGYKKFKRKKLFNNTLTKEEKRLKVLFILGIVFMVTSLGLTLLTTFIRDLFGLWWILDWLTYNWYFRTFAIVMYIFVLGSMLAIHIYQGSKLKKMSDDIREIDRVVEDIANGDFNNEFQSKKVEELEKLRNNIASIDSGFKLAIEDELKSERMKAELITNVSHDLKTPLTSIINYVDLLQKSNIDELDREDYLKILDNKSKRLKALIEDLFEASKASTGNLQLNIENVDVVAILRQAFAEFKERIDSSTLSFKTNIPDNKVKLDLDGAKTWRVFENLIGNALKYSMPHSRVYIDLFEKADSVVFEIKNMSGYELNCDPNELKERFKRADESRNTEGSGLGLAIANSLVELQGGRLDILIDGDLFKVIVVFDKN